MRRRFIHKLLCLSVSITFTVAGNADGEQGSKHAVLIAEDFGLAADGVTDDGDAIGSMLARARQLDGPVELRFPQDKVICVKSGVGRYAFALSDFNGLRIDGRGSEFRLAPELRFLRAERCSDLVVMDLQVDFLRQPTTSGTITGVDAQAKAIDVKLDNPAMAAALGGPTGEDGEQAFFGMIQLDAVFGTQRVFHYDVDRVTVASPGVVRVFNRKPVWDVLTKHVKPGETRVGLPVPGVAHRHGPGGLFVIDHCRDVTVSQVEVWSAPWFSFQLFRNEGRVAFDHVNVRPRPGSRKVLSSCRDAIHAKGNRAELLFEDCILEGLGDDAFNLSTHCSRVMAIDSPSRITVAQQYPLEHIPFRAGDTLILMDPENNRKVAERTIRAVATNPSRREPRAHHLSPWAPASVLTLDRPVSKGLRTGLVAWSRESANPKSIIRRCVIRRSCRLQTNTMIEECDVQALLWFYGAKIEGPGPEFVVVRKSRLRSNGLSPDQAKALIISGWEGSRSCQSPAPADALLRHVEITDNEIQGRVRVVNALKEVASGNTIRPPEETNHRLENMTPDLIVPPVTNGLPGPGKRVKQFLPGYDGTEVYHTLYLPTDWEKEKKYPVIVEYSGNKWKSSQGTVDECDLGYGISGGKGVIWVCLPFVDKKNGQNAATWWGDVDATVAYCKQAVSTVCAEYGGDSSKVFIAGFSRGAIACNYIGLHDDEIASLWRGFICHSHYDGVRQWGYAGSDRSSAATRLKRLGTRPQFISQERSVKATKTYLKEAFPSGNFTFLALPFADHTDQWVLRDIAERKILREWFENVLTENDLRNEY